ncbi:unnamed protein product [Cuscuta europaea]|uniref:Retrotransposon gag domain-containing protein n=1 Tax=Cuscuta europaea TaxID=41803 RepID=A0A9P1DXP3_CUSEU|nr:unnamed protein product [Cuscuta europaea]
MTGSSPLLEEIHAQMEAVRTEFRRELAERMAHPQRENDLLRSQVQSAVSIASNSRGNRRNDLMPVVTRLDLESIPTATDTPTIASEPISLTLGLSPAGESQTTVISQVIPYTPLIPETTLIPRIPTCFFPESLRPGSRRMGLQAATQSLPMTSGALSPTEPYVTHYQSRTRDEPGLSGLMQEGTRSIFDELPPVFQAQRQRRPTASAGQNRGGRRPEVIIIPSPTRPEATPMAGLTVSAPESTQPVQVDPIAMIMEQLRQMQDKINGLPGVPLPLDRASKTCYADSPFSRQITDVEVPRKFNVPSMKMFDGTSDPVEHVAQYKQRMLAVSLRPDQREACMCRGFGATLAGPALKWFVNLPNEGIESFAELVDSFNHQFASSRILEKQTSDLYRIIQRRGESLRDYLHRFNKEKVSIPRCDIPTAVEAFRRGLSDDSELYRELTKYPCRTFEDVEAKTLAFIRLEEDQQTRHRQDAYDGGQRKSSTSKKHDYRTGKPYVRTEDRPVSSIVNWLDDPDLPPVINDYCFNVATPGLIHSLEKLGEKVIWPRRTDKPAGRRDPNKRCDFHGDIGHNTEDCVALRKEVAYLLKNGYLTEIMSERTKSLLGRDGKASPDESRPPSPSAPCKVINFINGGSDLCGLTYSAAKRHARDYTRDKSLQVYRIGKRQEEWRNASITFDETDISDPVQSHHDTLVVSLRVANYEVKRILVDNGSTANITTMKTLEELGAKEEDITGSGSSLVGFNGEPSRTVGNISLPVYTHGLNMQVKFDVVESIPAYNMILGTPWLHQMGAIPSTYHQIIKFPTPWGVQSIKGDRQSAKSCYQTAMKPTADQTASTIA